MCELVLRNVCSGYVKGKDILNDISLHIPSGKFVVLVGPSGSGKSTLLRAISGLEKIRSGALEMGGQRVNDYDPSKRDIAMVFQSYALYPHMTVRGNMRFALRFTKLGKKEIDERVVEVARLLGIEDYLDRKPRALSGGQRQRVAIGRAIVRQPKVFLFDEPLSNLDADLRAQMRIEITRLHKMLPTTMLYVTHDQVEAMTLADMVVILNNGKIEQSGAPLEIYDDPDNIFVAKFIGSPSMNFFSGEVCRGENGEPQIRTGADRQSVIRIPPAKKFNVGEKITVGIRPEHFVTNGNYNVDMKVEFLERLGSDTYIYAKSALSDTMVTLKWKDDRSIKTGDMLKVGMNFERMYFFDKSGVRI